MITAFVLMINVLSSATIFSVILSPVKVIGARPTVKSNCEFRNIVNPGKFWRRPNLPEIYPRRVMMVYSPKKERSICRTFFRPFGWYHRILPLTYYNMTNLATYFKMDGLSPGNILASAELNPMLKLNGRIMPTKSVNRIRKRELSSGILTPKIPSFKNIVSSGSSYPGSYAADKGSWPLLGGYVGTKEKKKDEKEPYMTEEIQWISSFRHQLEQIYGKGPEFSGGVNIWPLLGVYSQIAAPHISGSGAKDFHSSHLDGKRQNQMSVIRKLSEMKAKEHIAEDNRLAEMHKTQEAKKEFQQGIAEQLDLLSQAKGANLRAIRAFEKVLNLERSLSNQDREIHRMKEAEDQLYQDLLESEAEVAMEDIRRIPKLHSEEDLQGFMSERKLV